MKRLLLVALCAVMLTGCGVGRWFTGGPSNLERPAELSALIDPVRVERRWAADAGAGLKRGHLLLSPALQNDALYAADAHGQVSAYGARDGKRIWRVELDQPVTAGTGYGEGLVLLGTKNGDVIALERENGQQKWLSRVSSEILAPPRIHSGVVLVQTVDGKLSGLDARDGRLIWTLERSVPALSLRGTGSPVAVSGVGAVLAGFASGKLLAANLRDGRLLWEAPIAEPHGRNEIERMIDVDAPPLVVGKVAYAAAYQGKVVAINLESGQLLWSKNVSTYSAMDHDQRYLYLVDEKGHLYALDLNTGAQAWRQEGLYGRVPSAPVATSTHVVVGDFEGYVHWLDKHDGSLDGRYKMGSEAIKVKPVTDGDNVYVLDQDANLAALRARP
jgi:outer membrane protein assembly factor BamB